jgi:hypothetical protein
MFEPFEKPPPSPMEQSSNMTQDFSSLEKRQGACKANTLLFARATIETPPLGAVVGPGLSTSLPKGEWATVAVSYTNDINGIYCLGMEGGMRCVQQLNALAKRCPKTKIVASGYSQGCMVARFCVAHASEQARAQVKVCILLFIPLLLLFFFLLFFLLSPPSPPSPFPPFSSFSSFSSSLTLGDFPQGIDTQDVPYSPSN